MCLRETYTEVLAWNWSGLFSILPTLFATLDPASSYNTLATLLQIMLLVDLNGTTPF